MRGDEPLAGERVVAHGVPLRLGQAAGLLQHRRRDAQLADVVEQGAHGQLEKRRTSEAEARADPAGEPGDVLGMRPPLEVVREVPVGERAQRAGDCRRAVAASGIRSARAHVRIPHSGDAPPILRPDHPGL
jgi:hypothetical protein